MQLIADPSIDSVHVVLELVKDNEGQPGIWAYRRAEPAQDHMARLLEENKGNPDVLIVYEEVKLR